MDKDTVAQYGWTIVAAILVAVLIVGIVPVAHSIMGTVEAEVKNDSSVYTITLDPNGGNLTQEYILVSPRKAYGFLPTPSLEGLTFAGWFTEPNGGVEITPQTIFKNKSNSTLYAHWE